MKGSFLTREAIQCSDLILLVIRKESTGGCVYVSLAINVGKFDLFKLQVDNRSPYSEYIYSHPLLWDSISKISQCSENLYGWIEFHCTNYVSPLMLHISVEFSGDSVPVIVPLFAKAHKGLT